MEQNMDSILEKIQKIMALQQGATTPSEAANCAARISEMLLRYNLSIQDVNSHKADDGVDTKKGAFDDYQNPYDGTFAELLLDYIAYFNFCRLIKHPDRNPINPLKNKGKFTLVGKKYNVEVAYFMFDYCLIQIKSLFNQHWDLNKKQILETSNKNPYRRAYYQGAVFALSKKLKSQREEAIESQPMSADGSNPILSLIKVNDLAVDTKIKELFPSLRTAKPIKVCQNINAHVQGYKDGKTIELIQALNGDGKHNQKALK